MITISILTYSLSPPLFIPSGNEGVKERDFRKGLYFFQAIAQTSMLPSGYLPANF